MRKHAVPVMIALLLLSGCAQDRGTVEVEPVDERQPQQQGTDGTSLEDVQRETREAWEATREYTRRVTAATRDDVEDKLNQASDDFRELRRDAERSETAQDLERELQSVRQDFNRLSREARESETAETVRQEWQELEARVEELSADIRRELQTQEGSRE